MIRGRSQLVVLLGAMVFAGGARAEKPLALSARPASPLKSTPLLRLKGDSQALAQPSAQPVRIGAASLLLDDGARRLASAPATGRLTPVHGQGKAPPTTSLRHLGAAGASLASGGQVQPRLGERVGEARLRVLSDYSGQ